jgi:hypothetical protein
MPRLTMDATKWVKPGTGSTVRELFNLLGHEVEDDRRTNLLVRSTVIRPYEVQRVIFALQAMKLSSYLRGLLA